MEFESSRRKATALTIRDNIQAGEAAKSLADKYEVTIKALADCTILASYAQHQHYFIFPFVVRGADSKRMIIGSGPSRPYFPILLTDDLSGCFQVSFPDEPLDMD